MTRGKISIWLGLVTGLMVVAGGYFMLNNLPLSDLFPFITPVAEKVEVVEDPFPQTLPVPAFNTLDDDNIREALPRFHQLGLPAQARVSRLDKDGAWSSIFLGPFASQEEIEEAQRQFVTNFGPWPAPEHSLKLQAGDDKTIWPQILIELPELVSDEDLFMQLEEPYQAGISAFGRTAIVTGGLNGEGVEPRNRIYLGPFHTEEEALGAMRRLDGWPAIAGFTVHNLAPPPPVRGSALQEGE